MSMNRGGWTPFRFTGTAITPLPQSGPGSILHVVTFNTIVASATITLTDVTPGGNIVYASVTMPSTITGVDPFYLLYDMEAAGGWAITASSAMDVTVTYS